MFEKKPTDTSDHRDNFGHREVGPTHPDYPSFVKLNDTGGVEIFAKPGLGIYLDPETDTCVIMADNIKVMTREEGFHWNNRTFNSRATTYTEPPFVPYDFYEVAGLYDGIDDFLEDE